MVDEKPTGRSSMQRQWVASEGSQLVSIEDLLAILLLLIELPFALLPQRFWWGAARKISSSLARISFLEERSIEFCKWVPDCLVTFSGLSTQQIAENCYAAYLVGQFEVIRASIGLFKPRPLKLVGVDRLRAALAGGKGAIVWVEQSFSSGLMAKAALSQAGFTVHHISRPSHGGTNTRFGIKYLAAITRRAEAPYLAERIVLTKAGQVGAMRQTREVLRQGGLVSITVSDTAVQVVEVSALGGVLRLGSGAPHLAYAAGAALLPVFCHRDATGYTVEVREPISTEGASRQQALAVAAEAYAEQLSGYVGQYPLDWSGWFSGAYVGRSEPTPVA